MYKTINVGDFRDAFRDYGREENFSYEGLGALFEYLEELEEDIGEPIELDVIALCCEYTEYSSFEELQENYPHIEDLDDLMNYTTVIEVGDEDEGLIIQDF